MEKFLSRKTNIFATLVQVRSKFGPISVLFVSFYRCGKRTSRRRRAVLEHTKWKCGLIWYKFNAYPKRKPLFMRIYIFSAGVPVIYIRTISTLFSHKAPDFSVLAKLFPRVFFARGVQFHLFCRLISRIFKIFDSLDQRVCTMDIL